MSAARGGALSNLQWLRIAGCPEITDRSIAWVFAESPSLNHLFAEQCTRITVKSMQMVSGRMQTRDLEAFTGRARANTLPLRMMVLYDLAVGSGSITREVITCIASFQCLRSLRLEGLVDLDDRDLLRIAGGCPLLQSLDLTGCGGPGLTHPGIAGLARLPSLTVLILTDCNISDPALTSLSQCSLLVKLSVAGSAAVTIVGILDFARQCRRLCVRDLSGCKNISPSDVPLLADRERSVQFVTAFDRSSPWDMN